MAKKVKERELEEELIEQKEEVKGSASIEELVNANRNILLVVLGIILLIAAGYGFYRYTLQSKGTEASEEMYQAVYYFEQDSLDKALRGDGQNLGFEDIADEYKGTDAANLATYYLGIIALRQGDADTGIDYLKQFKKGDNMLSMAAYMALGFAYEDQGDPGQAASYFVKAAETPGENEHTTPTMLLHAGRNYEAAGQPDRARQLYQRIKDEYPTSSEGINIDKYLGRVAE
ncbi:MAG: hypothetical protein OHK0039_01420 [Bacteroidia bacterium]